uniref:nucleotide sugar dehydrogenase n=1 Tax=Microbacterium halophytorum TaxID=2067568 RepID=UPI001F490BAC
RLRVVTARALAGGSPFLVTDCATSELVKIAANAFLATKISFINAMSEIAEVAGADVAELADAIGCDPRIGRSFLNAGIGFGGGCLPKDIRAFAARAEELGTGHSTRFLREVDAINLRRRDHTADLVADALGDVAGRRVTVLGAAFKPNSDDVRDSPALDIAARLRSLGALVTVTDPEAIGNARRVHPELSYEPHLETALLGAHAVLVATEWEQYRHLDPERARELASGRVIVDGRNCLDADAWYAAGWDCIRMGRPALRHPAEERVLVGAGTL